MQDDAPHKVLTAFQHGVRLRRFGEGQRRVHRHINTSFLQQFRHHTLIVARCSANAVDVELLADHVDDAQWDLAQFPADRAERAAEAQGVDAQPHQFGRAGIFHRSVDAFAASRRTNYFDNIVSAAVDDDIRAPAL